MLLEVKDLVVKYGEITAISGISLEAEEGQLTTLIGSNGAGKSTLLKVLSGLMKPASGQIIFDGKDITGRSCDQIVRLGISHCPEGQTGFPQTDGTGESSNGCFCSERQSSGRRRH